MNISDVLSRVPEPLKFMFVPPNPDRYDALDSEFIRHNAPLLLTAISKYFDLNITGASRVPEGGALLVANHEAGISWLHLLAMGAEWYRVKQGPEQLYGMAHNLMFTFPPLGHFIARIGAVRADPKHALKLLADGHKVFVAPGGDKEAFRPTRHRNKVTLGDRRGFIRVALRAQKPIVPVVFAGGQDTFYVITDGQKIAQALQLPRFFRGDVWPLYLGLPWGISFAPLPHIPLPAKGAIHFLDPIHFHGFTSADADNPTLVDQLFEMVKSTMETELGEMCRMLDGGKYEVRSRKWEVASKK